jgi:hypothetical protein
VLYASSFHSPGRLSRPLSRQQPQPRKQSPVIRLELEAPCRAATEGGAERADLHPLRTSVQSFYFDRIIGDLRDADWLFPLQLAGGL